MHRPSRLGYQAAVGTELSGLERRLNNNLNDRVCRSSAEIVPQKPHHHDQSDKTGWYDDRWHEPSGHHGISQRMNFGVRIPQPSDLLGR
jgi:hypothetical protein